MKTKAKSLGQLPISELYDLGQSFADKARIDLIGAANKLNNLGLGDDIDSQLKVIKLELKK